MSFNFNIWNLDIFLETNKKLRRGATYFSVTLYTRKDYC